MCNFCANLECLHPVVFFVAPVGSLHPPIPFEVHFIHFSILCSQSLEQSLCAILRLASWQLERKDAEPVDQRSNRNTPSLQETAVFVSRMFSITMCLSWDSSFHPIFYQRGRNEQFLAAFVAADDRSRWAIKSSDLLDRQGWGLDRLYEGRPIQKFWARGPRIIMELTVKWDWPWDGWYAEDSVKNCSWEVLCLRPVKILEWQHFCCDDKTRTRCAQIPAVPADFLPS